MPAPDAPKYVQPHMTEALAKHVLDELTPSTSPVRSFRLYRPSLGSRMSTLLTFTPEGIVVQGDLRPGDSGAMASKDFDLAWFSGDQAEEDVCEAFLTKRWQPEAAARDLRRLTGSSSLNKERLERAAAAVEAGLVSEASVRDILVACGFTRSEADGVGFDFPLGDAGWLCAVQQRFSALRRQEA